MSEQTQNYMWQYLREVLAEDYVTLRDFFAGCSLIGELASQDIRHENNGGRGTGIAPSPLVQAESCYIQADAMMAARKEQTSEPSSDKA